MFHRITYSLAISVLAVSTPVWAQAVPGEATEKEASGPIDVAVTLTAVSDYRFRGVSVSDKNPAIQPSITLSHESGFYGGAWASNIAENAGDDVELDLYAGFAGGDALTYDLGVTYYIYPGISSLNYAEFIGKLGTTIGPVELGGTIVYAPRQDGTGNRENVSIGGQATLGVPNTPFKLNAGMGFEDGAIGDNKIDWHLGVTADVSGFTLGASYVDTNRFIGGLGKAGAIFSVSYGF